MTKEQAIRLMEQGKKVTHRYFSPKEYATIKNGQIVTEEGYSVPMKEFWAYRNIEGWNDGWEEFVESKALPSPGDNHSLEEAAKQYATPHFPEMGGLYEKIKAAFLAGAAYVKGGEGDKTDMGVYENYLRETTVTQSPSSIEESGLKEGEEEINEAYVRKFLIDNRVIRAGLQEACVELLLSFHNHITKKP